MTLHFLIIIIITKSLLISSHPSNHFFILWYITKKKIKIKKLKNKINLTRGLLWYKKKISADKKIIIIII